jgi:hypothetical protein
MEDDPEAFDSSPNDFIPSQQSQWSGHQLSRDVDSDSEMRNTEETYASDGDIIRTGQSYSHNIDHSQYSADQDHIGNTGLEHRGHSVIQHRPSEPVSSTYAASDMNFSLPKSATTSHPPHLNHQRLQTMDDLNEHAAQLSISTSRKNLLLKYFLDQVAPWVWPPEVLPICLHVLTEI